MSARRDDRNGRKRCRGVLVNPRELGVDVSKPPDEETLDRIAGEVMKRLRETLDPADLPGSRNEGDDS